MSLLSNTEWGSNYESTKCDQDVIEILKLVKRVMFNLYGNKELTHTMWESYV